MTVLITLTFLLGLSLIALGLTSIFLGLLPEEAKEEEGSIDYRPALMAAREKV